MQNIVLYFNIYLTNSASTKRAILAGKSMSMSASVSKFNTFLFFKLPAAWWTGVRLRYIDRERAVTSVKYRWINQNPFNSMFWAVQGMAAELSTGAMVIDYIKESNKKVSMLVLNNKANFSKKATGRINFECKDGLKIEKALNNAIETGEGQTLWMRSVGTNEEGIVVATFDFEWTLKLRS